MFVTQEVITDMYFHQYTCCVYAHASKCVFQCVLLYLLYNLNISVLFLLVPLCHYVTKSLRLSPSI